MTNELKKAIEAVKAYLDMDSDVDSEYLNAQRTIIKALESQPTRVDETYLSVKDAISELKAMREHIVGYMSIVGTTAYDMGIEALEAQPCIEDYPTCTECEHYDSEKHYCPRFCQVIKDTLAEAQPKTEIENLKTEIEKPKSEMNDLISREDVITALIDADWIKTTAQQAVIAEVLNKIPSVKPKKGKWIKCKSRFGVAYFKCSECGRKLNLIDRDYNYCNNCGSDNSESTKEWFKEWDTKLAEMSGGREDEVSD